MCVRETGKFGFRKVTPREWQLPVTGMKAWSIAFVRRNDLGNGCNPVHRLITHVPDQAQPTVWLKHSVYLGKGRFICKPVEGLGAYQCLRCSGVERNRFGCSF